MAGYPPFSHAVVVTADASTRSLHVILASGQAPAAPIKMLHHGSADAVTVSHAAMPRPGTRGLVAFVGGDPRSGLWLGSYYAAGNDAFTSDTDPNLELASHWSGNYEMTTGDGQYTQSFSDGTFIQVASSVTKPVLNRHTIDETQTRNLVAFPDSARITTPPSARHVIINHASGAIVHIDPTGNITVQTASPNPASIMMYSGGDILIDSAGGVVTITSPTSINLDAPIVNVSGTVIATGDIVAGAVSLESHYHSE